MGDSKKMVSFIIILSTLLVGCGGNNNDKNIIDKAKNDVKEKYYYKDNNNETKDKISDTNKKNEKKNDTKKIDNLDGFLFIGDSFFTILKGTINRNTNDAIICEKSGVMPSYWISHLDTLPKEDRINGVTLLIGVNGVGYNNGKTNQKDIKKLIKLLSEKYPNKIIYVQKVFPVGEEFRKVNAKEFNNHISKLNEISENYCDKFDNVMFIDATEGFIDSDGELTHTTDGLHIDSESQKMFYDNILKGINKVEE